FAGVSPIPPACAGTKTSPAPARIPGPAASSETRTRSRGRTAPPCERVEKKASPCAPSGLLRLVPVDAHVPRLASHRHDVRLTIAVQIGHGQVLHRHPAGVQLRLV